MCRGMNEDGVLRFVIQKNGVILEKSPLTKEFGPLGCF
jgi:hypothetical protein